ncbi:unnamed protein product, partial [Amoebophrya sp. A120]
LRAAVQAHGCTSSLQQQVVLGQHDDFTGAGAHVGHHQRPGACSTAGRLEEQLAASRPSCSHTTTTPAQHREDEEQLQLHCRAWEWARSNSGG